MTAEDMLRDLTKLVAPGGGHDSTIPGTQRPTAAPRGWEPGVKYAADGLGMVVTTPAHDVNVSRDEAAWGPLVEKMGLQVPPGYAVRLVEAKYDEGAWSRDSLFTEWPDADEREQAGKSRYTKTPATRVPCWRYRFAIEPDAGRIHAEDVERIIGEVLRKRRKRPAAAGGPVRGLNVVFADPQAGKVALLGGTRELAERVGVCFDLLTDHLADLKKVGRYPTEASWWDGGDCIENFNNVRAQERTNDLHLTQQTRAHRRFTIHGLDYLAGRFPTVRGMTAGSNHAQERVGKDPSGPPVADWGIEVMSSVQDAFALNPGAYGHVSFGYPHDWRDSLAVESGGLLIGLAHGHQFRNGTDKAVRDWWMGQTFGRQPVADARVLVSGHFHHFAAREMGDGRLWVQAPTLDNGSDWWTRLSGEISQPGLLVFSTTPDGWDDLKILRPNQGAAA